MPKLESIAAKASRYLTTVFVILLLNFLIPRLAPGDPILYLLGEDVYDVSPEIIEELRAEYGLDKPLYTQFALYLLRLLNGDFGYSFSFGKPILEILSVRVPLTLLLTVPSTLIGILLGVYLGAIAGWRSHKFSRKVLSGTMIAVYSIPPYWFAMILLLIFSLHLKLFPIGGAPSFDADLFDFLSHMFLPTLTITVFTAAYNTLIMRGIILGVSNEPFIITALSKGLRKTAFLNRHLLRPSLPALLAITAIEFGFTFSGALLVEIAFSWPGMGLMLWEAVLARDYPLIQAIFTISSLIVVSANLLADMLCMVVDPRLRSSHAQP
ncbi:peptide ABC transporter permease [Candidatus Bathyarchaeota archaeon B24-2]|nr:MAG: peptide ABC transporter permease [Candidatus Bathyarchaeota archaeon B24-2]